jgi:hypothetical protein
MNTKSTLAELNAGLRFRPLWMGNRLGHATASPRCREGTAICWLWNLPFVWDREITKAYRISLGAPGTNSAEVCEIYDYIGSRPVEGFSETDRKLLKEADDLSK